MKTSRDFVDELDNPDWAEAEFEQAPLVDRRLNKRVSQMVGDFARHPGAPIPQACESKAKTKGAYRFLENDDVQPEQILAGHRQASLPRLAREPVILAPSDTTTFDFSNLHQTTGLGPTGPRKKGADFQGLLLHSTLAFTPAGLPLGLISAQFWARSPEPSPEPRKPNQLPFEEKESVRWRESLEACQALRAQLPPSALLVNITDREGDIYEVFAAALAQPQPRAELLVRSCSNRMLAPEEEEHLLWDALAKQPVAATLQVRVPRDEKHPARLANLHIRFTDVILAAPSNKRKERPLPVWAVEAREFNAPPGVEPILWRLLTTLPVTTAEEAIEKVAWYTVRWGIEVFHKVVKSVCKAEDSQLQTAARLERALMLDLVVAWRVDVLTQVGRQNPDLPASDYFAESEWKALHSYIYQQPTAPIQAPRLGQFMQWLGQLGGFIPSKSHPYPGPITFARGLTRLSDLAAMWGIQNAPSSPCKE